MDNFDLPLDETADLGVRKVAKDARGQCLHLDLRRNLHLTFGVARRRRISTFIMLLDILV